jgi:hypothetical protein
MRKTYFILLFLISANFCFGQNGVIDVNDSCFKIPSVDAYFWRQDSIGNNGFRSLYYKHFLKCKYSNHSLEYITQILGKPNGRIESNKGTTLYYFYLNGETLPKELGKFAGNFIGFDFNKNFKLVYISDGHFDW